MWGIVVFIAIIVLSSAIGAVSQWLKAQKQLEQDRAAHQRANPAARRDRPDSTIDRYVEEVERLRRRPAGDPRAVRPPTTVAPVVDAPVVVPVAKKRRVSDGGGPSFLPARPAPPVRVEDLPSAPVVAPPPAGGGAATQRPRPIAAAGVGRVAATGPLADLFKSKQSVALAFVLSEVFGPPKCRRHGG